MPSRLSERRRLVMIDWLAKKHKWRNIAIVGVSDAKATQFLLDHARAIKRLVTVVRWKDGLRPAEAGQQRVARKLLERFDVVKPNFTLIERADAGPGEAKEHAPFDAVLLLGIEPHELAEAGLEWAPQVRDGGWLVGVDHREAAVRSILDAAGPEWQGMIEGVWGVRVNREGDGGAPVVDGDAPQSDPPAPPDADPDENVPLGRDKPVHGSGPLPGKDNAVVGAADDGLVEGDDKGAAVPLDGVGDGPPLAAAVQVGGDDSDVGGDRLGETGGDGLGKPPLPLETFDPIPAAHDTPEPVAPDLIAQIGATAEQIDADSAMAQAFIEAKPDLSAIFVEHIEQQGSDLQAAMNAPAPRRRGRPRKTETAAVSDAPTPSRRKTNDPGR
jgi:hypothetical protein